MIWNRPFRSVWRRFGDVALIGRRGDARAGDGERVGAGDSAANDVGRLLCRGGSGENGARECRKEGEMVAFHTRNLRADAAEVARTAASRDSSEPHASRLLSDSLFEA